MNRIRLATVEEVKAIEKGADLDETCLVYALNTQQGVPLAVVRMAVEVDPVIYPEGLHDRMKAMFQRDIETTLQAKGVSKYYFNVHVSNKPMLEVAKTLGAEQMSTEPEYRFRVIL
jgi:hypothetical protein